MKKMIRPIFIMALLTIIIINACGNGQKNDITHKSKSSYRIYADSIPPVIVNIPMDSMPLVNLYPNKDSALIGIWVRRWDHSRKNYYQPPSFSCLFVYCKDKVIRIKYFDIPFNKDTFEIWNDPSIYTIFQTKDNKPVLMPTFNIGKSNMEYGYQGYAFIDTTEALISYYYEKGEYKEGYSRIPSLHYIQDVRAQYITQCSHNDTFTIGRWENWNGYHRIFKLGNYYYLIDYNPKRIEFIDRMIPTQTPQGLRLDYEPEKWKDVNTEMNDAQYRKVDSSLIGAILLYQMGRHYILDSNQILSCYNTKNQLYRSDSLVKNWQYDYSRFDSLFYLKGDLGDTLFKR